jgi:hypothetical protein
VWLCHLHLPSLTHGQPLAYHAHTTRKSHTHTPLTHQSHKHHTHTAQKPLQDSPYSMQLLRTNSYCCGCWTIPPRALRRTAISFSTSALIALLDRGRGAEKAWPLKQKTANSEEKRQGRKRERNAPHTLTHVHVLCTGTGTGSDTRARTCTHAHARTHARMHARAHASMHACTHAHTHTHKRARTHTHTHTHCPVA